MCNSFPPVYLEFLQSNSKMLLCIGNFSIVLIVFWFPFVFNCYFSCVASRNVFACLSVWNWLFFMTFN